MFRRTVLYTIMVISFLLCGCSNKQDEVKVTPTILFEKVDGVEQEDIYALLVSIATNDIQTDLTFHEFRASYSDIFDAFDSTGDDSLNQDKCTELFDRVSNELGGKQRTSTCKYVKYTKEGEEKAQKAKITLKFYSYEGELLLEYEGKLFDDFEFIKNN